MILRRRSKKKLVVSHETAATYNLSDSTAPNGAYAADSLSADFYNGAGSRSGNTFTPSAAFGAWGALTKATSRDQEVVSNFNNGIVYLRVTSERAIYFQYQPNSNLFEVGVVTGLDTSTPSNRFYYYDYNINSKYTYSSSDVLTFGAVGFDLYFKANGNTIYSAQEYGHVEAGQAGIKTTSMNGFAATTLVTKALLSNLSINEINAGDFYIKEGHTTGSMASGGYTLTVADPSVYKPLDRIIIEIGGEPSMGGRPAGTRGTRGGGPTFPLTSYANESALMADLSKPNNFCAWAEDTGLTYQRNTVSGDPWHKLQYFQTVGQGDMEVNYYWNYAVPMAYVGKILSIAGNDLTMDTAANTSITNANVYYDSTWILSKLTANPSADSFMDGIYPNLTKTRFLEVVYAGKAFTIKIPPGNYAVSEAWLAINRPGLTIKGSGINNTRIFSPRGTPCFNMTPFQSHGIIVKDLMVEGNNTSDGYGFRQRSWSNPSNVPDFNYMGNANDVLTKGIDLVLCDNAHVTNVRVKNTWMTAISFQYCNGGLADYSEILHTTGQHMYTSWMMNADSCSAIWFDNITFYSAKIIGACEIFTGNDCKFTNMTITNGRVSSNSSQGLQVLNSTITLEPLSRSSWLHPFDPLVNFNRNADNFNDIDDPLTGGGLVDGLTILIEGYIDVYGNTKQGIVVTSENSNVTIKNYTYTAPDYNPSSITQGAEAITSTGQNVNVEDVFVYGLASNDGTLYGANVGVQFGSVKRVHANRIAVGGDVVLGTGADANVGTIIVV